MQVSVWVIVALMQVCAADHPLVPVHYLNYSVSYPCRLQQEGKTGHYEQLRFLLTLNIVSACSLITGTRLHGHFVVVAWHQSNVG